jgi:hypothetical protein
MLFMHHNVTLLGIVPGMLALKFNPNALRAQLHSSAAQSKQPRLDHFYLPHYSTLYFVSTCRYHKDE